MSWSVDGVQFNLPCNIEREAEVVSSEISGMMLNKQYFNDVLGKWMKYNITVAIPRGMESEYEMLYEILTNPQDAHVFNLPYNYSSDGINLTARVTNVRDSYVRLPKGKQTWRKTSFDIIANHPTETPDGETVGMTAMPESASAEIGDLYEFTEWGWIMRDYSDLDDEGF